MVTWKPVYVLCLVSVLAGCRSSQPTSAPESAASQPPESNAGRIYTTNEVGGDMTIIDAGTNRVLATIPLGKRPRGIHPSPDHSTLYVALSGTPIAGPDVDESTLPPADHSADGIGVFDVAQKKLIRIIPGGSDPENFDVSQDGKKIYVSNEDVSAVGIIDIATGTIKSLPVGAQPEGVKVAPDNKSVYVTSEETSEIFILDPVAEKIVGKFKVGHRPRSVAFTPDSKTAYINAENDGAVVVVDTARRKVIHTIALGTPGQVKPMAVLLSPDAKRLYVSTGRGKRVFIIDTATNTVLNSVEVGQRPWGIALSPDGKTLYSANGSSNDVSVIDVDTASVKQKIPAGKGPWGVVVLEH
jgi:PQQ-dependent catabolism-associated beta-propeller protein